jgi:nucleoside-diphosphate-sugar epimerase
METNNTQLILGFTGGIGRAVALALSKRNIPMKALVRDKTKAEKYVVGLNNLTLIEGDASNPADLEKAFKGIDIVYYCINIPYPQWEKHALSLLSKSVEAAIKHKVKFIFPGNVYVYGHARYNPVNEEHPHAAHTIKGQIRMEMEEMLAIARKERGLDYAIIRMPDFYGPFVLNTFSEQVYINALKGKTLQWIGDLDIETELIFIEDGGEAMVIAAVEDKSNGEVFNVPGSETTTARKYLAEIVNQANSNSKISTINGDWIFTLFGLFNPMIKEVQEMLYLKREKLILDGSKFKKTFTKLPATDYATGVNRTLNWAKDYYNI